MIAAQPGWHIAVLLEGEGRPPQFSYEAILAWDLTRTEEPYDRSVKRPKYPTYVHHDVEPIICDGNMRHLSNRWGIRKPDGSFEFECDSYDNDNEAELLAEIAKERAA